MNKERVEEYRKIIEESKVIFLPFTGDTDLLEASSDKRIFNKYELKRKYPAYTFITRDFELDDTEGYLLVSKHYLRENIPSLMRAKTSELIEIAENMMGVLMTKIKEIKIN